MAAKRFITLLAFTLLFTLSVSSDPADLTPAPAPQTGSDDSPPLPSPSPSVGSPPAPPPSSDLAPTPAPISSPSPATSSPPHLPPTPEAANAADLSSANVKSEESKESSGGMSGGKKAGIAIGVIGAACVVGFGGILYKKRQQNIRRAEFSSAARAEFL